MFVFLIDPHSCGRKSPFKYYDCANYELEMKEHHTYCILKKRTNRLHPHGKPVHVHPKQFSTFTHGLVISLSSTYTVHLHLEMRRGNNTY